MRRIFYLNVNTLSIIIIISSCSSEPPGLKKNGWTTWELQFHPLKKLCICYVLSIIIIIGSGPFLTNLNSRRLSNLNSCQVWLSVKIGHARGSWKEYKKCTTTKTTTPTPTTTANGKVLIRKAHLGLQLR